MLHADGLKGLIIFLAVAGIVVPLFHRARIGTVLGFLVAGVVLGPHGLGRFADTIVWLRYVTFDDPERGGGDDLGSVDEIDEPTLGSGEDDLVTGLEQVEVAERLLLAGAVATQDHVARIAG